IRLTRQVAFEATLIELLIVEAPKCRGQTTKGTDQSGLRGNDVDDEAESRIQCKVETLLGFTLRLSQRISRREKVRVQVIAAVRGKREVTGLARGIEGATYQVTARPDVPRPRHDEIAEAHICPGLIASQAMLLDQLIPRPAELETGLIVVKVPSRDHAQEHIREARSVAVAVLEAEIDHTADHERKKILVGEQGRRHDLGQNIQSSEHGRVAHQRQFDQVLDTASVEPGPYPFVFGQRLLSCRMRR